MRRLLVFMCVALAFACSGTKEPTPPQGLPEMRPVPLPDMSGAAEAVQTKIRDRHAALTKAIQDPSTPSADLARAYGEMGKLFIAAEYYDAAEAALVNATRLAPAEMNWPYLLGHVFRLKSDTTQAATWFERARVIKPDYVPTLVWLAEMHLAANRIDEAERLLMSAQALDPGSGAVLYGLGRAALAKQQYAQAVSYLEKALSIGPSATRIHYPLAMAYRGLGNARQTELHLKQRGEVGLPPVDPLLSSLSDLLENAATYETRGAQALQNRQWSEAVSQLSKAVVLAPANASSRLNLGAALYMQGNAAGALEQYREAVRLSPSSSRAHFGIGVLMESRGQDREAIEAFSTAVNIDPGYLEAQFSLANALRRNGRVQESLPHYSEILRIDPAVSQAKFGYAMGLVRLGRYQEARGQFEEAMKAFPDQPGFPHALARLLAAAPDDRLRDGRRALDLMTTLLKKQRTLGLSETMAMTQAELGRFEEAARWQRETIDAARQSGRPELVPRLTETLRLYEAKQACRTPWPDDDPVHHPVPAP